MQIEAATAEARATSLLEHLGFSPELRGRPMSALSGGWRVRTALAAAIFARPDLLLLDEPTNHLSIAAVLWLSRELCTNTTWQQRIVVVVSHDRVFLDEISSDTLHVSGAARKLKLAVLAAPQLTALAFWGWLSGPWLRYALWRSA